MNTMCRSLIWAMAKNRVIGRDNQLPWRLPKDLAFFKATTLGKPIIMGRRTFESIGRPLPGRTTIVVSRSGFARPGVETAGSVAEAFASAERIAARTGVDEALVVGGAEIYAAALPSADRLYVTRIDAEIAGDTHFPALALDAWRQVSRTAFTADERHPYAFEICVFER